MGLDWLTIWLVAGIVLLIAELLTGTFMLMFLSLASFSAALVSLHPAGQSTVIQAVIFFAVVVVGIFGFRKPLQKRFIRNAQNMHSDLGQHVDTDSAIAPRESARVMYQGTRWQALNVGETDIPAGARAIIVAIDGNSLLIKKA
jgi:membrane protein implicated in regulation of membrane protease activity